MNNRNFFFFSKLQSARAGFSLVEAILAAALLGIIVSGAMSVVSNFGKSLSKNRLQATMSSLESMLQASLEDPETYEQTVGGQRISESIEAGVIPTFNVNYAGDIIARIDSTAASPSYFTGNGESCAVNSSPRQCPIEVIADLQITSVSGINEIQAAYSIKVRPGSGLTGMNTISMGSNVSNPGATPKFPAADYDFWIPPESYDSQIAGSQCPPGEFLRGLTAGGIAQCWTRPSGAQCGAGEFAVGITENPGGNGISYNCLPFRVAECQVPNQVLSSVVPADLDPRYAPKTGNTLCVDIMDPVVPHLAAYGSTCPKSNTHPYEKSGGFCYIPQGTHTNTLMSQASLIAPSSAQGIPATQQTMETFRAPASVEQGSLTTQSSLTRDELLAQVESVDGKSAEEILAAQTSGEVLIAFEGENYLIDKATLVTHLNGRVTELTTSGDDPDLLKDLTDWITELNSGVTQEDRLQGLGGGP